MIPESVGPYRVEGILGKGGMGVVYAARHPDGGPPLALKLQHTRSPRSEARLRREAELCARLRHPNLVPVVDAGEHAGRPYVVFRRIEDARPLSEVLDGLPEAQRLDLLEQTARGLACAHAAGIVHRDVKPENVLVDPQGRAYVADFGVARDEHVERLTQTGAVLGSLNYLAPEALVAEAPVTPAADVWALGAILYRALSGELPYPSQELFGYFRSLESPPPALPSSPLADLALRALARDPARRPADAQVFLEALLAARAAGPSRGRRRTALGIALLPLAALAIAFVALREPPPAAPAPPSVPPPAPPAADEPAWAPEPGQDCTLPASGARLRWVEPGSVSWRRGGVAHRLEGSQGFWIARSPATVGALRGFLAAHGLTRLAGGPLQGADDAPAAGLTWLEAAAYCRWAGLALPTRGELVRALLDPSLDLERAPELQEFVQDWWRPSLALPLEERDPLGPHLWRLALRAHAAPRDVPHRLLLLPASLLESAEDYRLPGVAEDRAGARGVLRPGAPTVDWRALRWRVRVAAREVALDGPPTAAQAASAAGPAREVPLLLGDWSRDAPAAGVLCAEAELELPAGTWGFSASGRGPVQLELPDHPWRAPTGGGLIRDDPGRAWAFRPYLGRDGRTALDLQGAHRVLELAAPTRVRVRLTHAWRGACELAALIYPERCEPAPR
ncbi:MAG: protein kinase [Planctomycetota bacterium]